MRRRWRAPPPALPWSLSRLTFPHGLAQLLVAEQLYRIATLAQGHPYHKT
jgi:23S rRNA (pseudouridine1915-N3)-methyltransferase